MASEMVATILSIASKQQNISFKKSVPDQQRDQDFNGAVLPQQVVSQGKLTGFSQRDQLLHRKQEGKIPQTNRNQ